MKSKICPILLSGLLGHTDIDLKVTLNVINTDINSDKLLPRCLQENCALWRNKFLIQEGGCGLIQ